MATIELREVSVDFGAGVVLDNISTTLTQRRVGIIGSNGSGKSTFARLLNGLTQPTSGQVLIDGCDVSTHGKQIRRRVGFIFSDADNQIVMPTVVEDVEFSLRRSKLPAAERHTRAMQCLERFGLADHAQASPHTLSGGQKQLLALAAVTVCEPDIIIADEPTTLLDLRNRMRMAQLFSRLSQQLIIVSHDMDLVRTTDRVLCIESGEIVADGAPDRVIDAYAERVTAHPPQLP
ncbi:energy-coupling factor ABC transporter ATP-binding protein [Corynebacterium uberis]|uniref:energy-coupling factor ABC transporter ATP-binding protein n=1 Tax=Corynebacterium TaxID=1716 RepID=UPI001D0A25BC|nr:MULTISPECIES: ABC transporter ATP-binding protein [Corynebacterium]MCZ9308479.1 energy-coupling factor ABC transporter ATP-binding protein [Corynebacterium sp. c6VSa_13]UDL74140.1 energy-coupling factor ABC transporter ATP-binding protein [Corynebacterium uberis]UDL74976.1 energy-coupling factor ABC transporter ATP-binding protein [Corynebacterium uberis]UDL77191.1 energy-coupling factor ABC transporter ATP-binding protein [Corynebacterium uberis]UDL79473.1 energy-coupling factor ABC transp